MNDRLIGWESLVRQTYLDLTDIPHISLRVSKEPAILHDGYGRGIHEPVNYPIGLTKPSLGAVN